MMDAFKFIDGYALRARLYPALLTLLPALATVLVWFPSLLASGIGAAIVTVISACGIFFLLAEVSRSQGLKVQATLLRQWGVFPSTQMLRHADTSLPLEVKARYHAFLTRKLGVSMPTVAEEKAEPSLADARYSSAILWLREQCRGAAFDLILNENTSYGFRRNLLGLRPWGLCVCIMAIASPFVFGFVRYEWSSGLNWLEALNALNSIDLMYFSPAVLGFFGIFMWLIFVRKSWVLEAAESYAARLLSACDNIK